MPLESIVIPVNSGQREDLDSKLLPDGLFKQVLNGRFRKTSELGVRYGFTALTALDTAGSTVRAFDVVSHNDALLCFGSTNSSAGGPEKVFTFLDDVTLWKGEDTGTRPRAFPAISELEQVFRPPFVKTDEDQLYDVAYAAGLVAVCFEGHATEGNVYVHIFDPDTGAVVLSQTVASRTRPKVIGVGSTFIFVWRSSVSAIAGVSFVVGTSSALSSETTLHNSGTLREGLDICPVSGASEFILVTAQDAGVTVLRRYNLSFVQQAVAAGTATDVNLLSVVSVSGGRTSMAYVDTSGNYELQSFTTSTLASAVAPVSLFGGSTGTRPPGIVRKNSTQLVVCASIPDTIDSQLKTDLRTETTLALVTATTLREVSSQSNPFVSSDGQFVGVISPSGEGALTGFGGIIDVEFGRGFECSVNRGTHVDALATWLPHVATDGAGTHYGVFPVTDLNCANMPIVYRWKAMSSARRQTASLGGLLYIAGGYVGLWDGVRLVESSYPDAPVILSATPSNGAGAMTPSALYVYAVAFDWYDKEGNRHLSPVSDDFPVTMGASDDTVTLVVSTPHSIRVAQGGDQAAKVIVYRTKAAPDRVKRRSVFAFPAASTFAASVSVVDLASDTEISTQEVIYTQGARSTLSGSLQHETAFPCQYLSAGRDRISSAGLPNQSEGQRSKRFFPGEPIEWSNRSSHRYTIRGRTSAVWSLDDVECVASRDEIFVVGGPGPDDNNNGEFDSPRSLPGNKVGCIRADSVLVTAGGVWFQAAPDRLYMQPRGGGEAQWLSQPVRDTLAAFPVIVGAAVCSLDDTAVWACNNTAGTDGRLVVLDLRNGAWYVDQLSEIASLTPIQALCEHNGRLHVVVANVVYRQDITFPATAFIPLTIITGSIAPSGIEGRARLKAFITTGRFRARHQIEGDVSFDDGVTFASMGSTVAAPVSVNSGYAAGDTVSLRWCPRRRKSDRFVLRLRLTTDGVASEAQTLSAIQLEVVRQRKARRASAKGT